MPEGKFDFDTVYMLPEHNDSILSTGQPGTVRSRHTVYVKPNSVSFRYSEYLMGRNKHSNKLYGRWLSGHMSVVRRTSTGKYAAMMRDFRTNRVYGGLHLMPAPTNSDARQFFNKSLAEIGVRTNADFYPALGHFRDGHEPFDRMFVSHINKYMPAASVSGRRKFYRSLHDDDPRAFISHITRKSYRKDIARALKKLQIADLSQLDYMNNVEEDLYAKVIETRDWTYHWAFANRNGKSVTAASLVTDFYARDYISRAKYLELLFDPKEAITEWHMSDTLRMLDHYAGNARDLIRRNGISGAHDILAREANANRNRANREREEQIKKPIEYQANVAAVHGAQVGEYIIALAETGMQLKEWGNHMGHCIGSYAYEAYRGAVLAAVMKNGKMVANFHLSMSDRGRGIYQMTQIFGKTNSQFADARMIYDYLAGVLPWEHSTPWGMEEERVIGRGRVVLI